MNDSFLGDSIMLKQQGITVLFAIVSLAISTHVMAGALYVDQTLPGDCLSAYQPNTRSCGAGSARAYKALSSGLAAVQSGDELLLREGVYGALVPARSGSINNPIVIRSYNNEAVSIRDVADSAIRITGLSDIVIDGLRIDSVGGFGKIYDSTRIVVKNTVFNKAIISGTTGGLKLVRTTYSALVNNEFMDAHDSVVLQDAADHNMIANNLFYKGRHSLLSVRCSNYNIIRENIFDNPDQKAMEIYDCEGTSDAPVRMDATKYNVIEKNEFIRTRASDRNYYYNDIQHGGQHTIVRQNIFKTSLGGGVNYQSYADESLHVYGNRMYNNTFYANRCYAIIGNSGDGSRYFDNQVMNNLLYKNLDCSGGASQITVRNTSQVILSNNAIVTEPPGFASEPNDLHLIQSSIHLNQGEFVTRTSSSGSGTVLSVMDASFFTDGFQAPGAEGDIIQLEGSQSRARVIAIDYGKNTLTLDSPMSWSAGRGVHLAYAESRPDMGAYEYSDSQISPPASITIQVE